MPLRLKPKKQRGRRETRGRRGMGMETDLWDDSALINAFDHALSKYKMMHISKTHDDTTEGEKSINNNDDHCVEEIHESVELDDKRNNTLEATAETYLPRSNNKIARELLPIHESQPEEGTCFSESHPELAGATSAHDKMDSYEEAEYTKLVSQYYEIEEKRQKILQQLQQVSYWNYPSSAQYQTPQHHQGTDTSDPGLPCSCCMCIGHCGVCPMHSSSCGSFCPWDACKSLSQTQQISAGIPTKFETSGQSVYANINAVETEKTATERDVSSMKFEASATRNVFEKNKHMGKAETSSVDGRQVSQTVNMETDLTVVLNAWYSAGFYTGRYLLEQSTKKGDH